MASESRKAPVQFGIRLRRILCGRAGWSGLVLQLVFAGLIIWLGYEIFANAKANLRISASPRDSDSFSRRPASASARV
jgi:general L-amino acid transport system permease protein